MKIDELLALSTEKFKSEIRRLLSIIEMCLDDLLENMKEQHEKAKADLDVGRVVPDIIFG
jgi:hypothetical protein